MLVSRTVYSLYLPETRAVLDTLWSSHPHAMYERNYERSQDAMHASFLARWRAWAREGGVELGAGFAHEYPTGGASEGITATLARVATRPGSVRPRLHVLEGEYEGYGHIAAALGLEVLRHPRAHAHDRIAAAARDGDVLMISQPSAIDGMRWPGFASLVEHLERACPGLELVVDLTYVGCLSEPVALALDRPNVGVVLASLSKPFGVYYHRIGALLSREPQPLLHGNLWFKNLFSLRLGEALMDGFGPTALPRRHRPRQQQALAQAIAAGAVPPQTRVAEVVLLASAQLHGDGNEFDEFVRVRERDGRTLRFCLSPAMDALIASGDPS
ncbi:MAG: hypothetical protein K1X88_01885 [Nannocystaceae bacterium]|nr:hypothetical protein [Nannocystaceae bacterium]